MQMGTVWLIAPRSPRASARLPWYKVPVFGTVKEGQRNFQSRKKHPLFLVSVYQVRIEFIFDQIIPLHFTAINKILHTTVVLSPALPSCPVSSLSSEVGWVTLVSLFLLH